MVPFAIVRSGEVQCCKTLPVNSLHDIRATLDHHWTQRNDIDFQHQDHVGPRNQDCGVNETSRTTRAHEIRTIPPTHQIRTTPIHPIRATGADDGGGISTRNRNQT